MELWIWLATIGTLTVLLMLVGIGFRNDIVVCKNRVKRCWADVIAYERRKLHTLPELEKKIGEYADFEQGVLNELTALRASVDSLNQDRPDPAALKEAERLSKSLQGGLRVAVEAYPELQASGLYAGFMRELSEAEENVAAAVIFFNCSVQQFNDRIQTIPGSWVNSIANKEPPMDEFSDSAAEAGFEYKPNL